MFDQTTDKKFSFSFNNTSSIIFLPPGKDVHFWTWNIGEDFDLSEPGIYHVSLGGRLAYLDTTVCSNMAEVKVGN